MRRVYAGAYILTAVCAGLIVILLIRQSASNAKQLKQLQDLSRSQQQIIQEIKKGVDDVKADNEKNTTYLQCLINIHALGIVPNNMDCHTEEAQATAATPQSTTTTSPSPSPAPTDTPKNPNKPTRIDSVRGLVNNVLKGVGL